LGRHFFWGKQGFETLLHVRQQLLHLRLWKKMVSDEQKQRKLGCCVVLPSLDLVSGNTGIELPSVRGEGKVEGLGIPIVISLQHPDIGADDRFEQGHHLGVFDDGRWQRPIALLEMMQKLTRSEMGYSDIFGVGEMRCAPTSGEEVLRLSLSLPQVPGDFEGQQGTEAMSIKSERAVGEPEDGCGEFPHRLLQIPLWSLP